MEISDINWLPHYIAFYDYCEYILLGIIICTSRQGEKETLKKCGFTVHTGLKMMKINKNSVR